MFSETGGNTGNLAFRYAVHSHLVNPAMMAWGASPDAIRAAGNVIVLPLANQLGRHTDLGTQATKLAEIGLPVVGIGLGAQVNSFNVDVELSAGTRAWLEVVTSLSTTGNTNLGLRGEFTYTQLEKLGFAGTGLVMGCPSNFLNLHDDIISAVTSGFSRSPSRIAVAAGIPYVKGLDRIEQNLTHLVTETNGAYITQHDISMVQLSRRGFAALDPAKFKMYREYIYPEKSDQEFKSWLDNYAYAFFDVRPWMDFLRRFDFVIGTRFHGIMLAIQAGVPAACIAHDSRTLEMCQTMNIPVRHHSEITQSITLKNILGYFSFDGEKYRENRGLLLKNYLRILSEAELQPSKLLSDFN